MHSSFLADIYGAHVDFNEPFIVMELGECSLYDLIYTPPENFQWNLKVKLEVLKAIAVCLDKLAKGDGQGNGICHGDLHAKNILVQLVITMISTFSIYYIFIFIIFMFYLSDSDIPIDHDERPADSENC